jgi:hypothetical protein
MNGFELYDRIKKLDNKVKVCFISAYDIDFDFLPSIKFPILKETPPRMKPNAVAGRV